MDEVSFSDFSKLEIKVGEILGVEDHPNADKLLVLSVNLDEEQPRTIVAGLKGHYNKDDLVGKKAVFITNLEPAQLRGIQSNGMILAAVSNDKANISILALDKDMPAGTKIS